MVRHLVIALLVIPIAIADSPEELCIAGSPSCGQCIKQHPSCGWCKDPHSKASSRCQVKSKLTPDICNPHYVYSPVTELKIPANSKALNVIDERTKFPVQISPQTVELMIKEGETLEVPFKFLHKENAGNVKIKDFEIITSNYTNKGIDISFTLECNGQKFEGKRCNGVKDGATVSAVLKVTLQNCGDGSTIAVSLGFYGSRSTGALFIYPQCGCDCERIDRIEKNSPLCFQHGDLICGQCECQSGRGGKNCDCPLSLFGVANDEELTNKCRAFPGAPVCSDKGQCKCGKCACDTHTLTGKFCECDNGACPRDADNKESLPPSDTTAATTHSIPPTSPEGEGHVDETMESHESMSSEESTTIEPYPEDNEPTQDTQKNSLPQFSSIFFLLLPLIAILL